jgi:nucleoside-diphosphate-sugar epimerase
MDDSKDKKVLVTGGRGFVGRTAVSLLRRAGHGVISLDQADVPSPDRVKGEIVCDINDTQYLHTVFEEQKIGDIIHLAAVLPTAAQRDPAKATRVNLDGSLRILEMARESGVRRFVFGSSLSVYGTCPAERVVSEADRAAPEDLYGAAKLYVEQLGALYRQHFGLEFVSLRIGRVVGPGAHSPTSAWRSEIFESLHSDCGVEIVLPYVGCERILVTHVNDVARMLITLLHASRPAHAVYNAPCESLIVDDLKHKIEGLNPNVRVKLGNGPATGNPRQLDCTRFEQEFGFQTASVFEQLKVATKN